MTSLQNRKLHVKFLPKKTEMKYFVIEIFCTQHPLYIAYLVFHKFVTELIQYHISTNPGDCYGRFILGQFDSVAAKPKESVSENSKNKISNPDLPVI